MQMLKRIVMFSITMSAVLCVHPNFYQKEIKGYHIVGLLKGLPEGAQVYLVKNKLGEKEMDTFGVATARNDRFEFSGQIATEGFFAFIKVAGINKGSLIIAMENANMEIVGNIDTISLAAVTGSALHTEYQAFVKGTASLKKKYEQLHADFLKAFKSKSSQMVVLKQQMKITADSIRMIRLKFIEEHPASPYTSFLVKTTSTFTTIQKQQEFNKLTNTAKNSQWGLELQQEIARLVRLENIKVGEMMPDFVSVTPEGKELSLYEVLRKGKYTLIDCWASWCGPCRAQTPNIKMAYDAFHKKGLNVLSVSFDAEAEPWKAAIAKDGMNWHNVSDLKGREGNPHAMLGLNAIPAYLLVDAQGRIIAIDAPGAMIAKTAADVGGLRNEALLTKLTALMP